MECYRGCSCACVFACVFVRMCSHVACFFHCRSLDVPVLLVCWKGCCLSYSSSVYWAVLPRRAEERQAAVEQLDALRQERETLRQEAERARAEAEEKERLLAEAEAARQALIKAEEDRLAEEARARAEAEEGAVPFVPSFGSRVVQPWDRE